MQISRIETSGAGGNEGESDGESDMDDLPELESVDLEEEVALLD
jgi:hypothetical protein